MIWRSGKDLSPRESTRADQESSLDREILEAVAQAIPDPFMLIDSEGTIAVANRAAEEALDTQLRGQKVDFAIRTPSITQAVATIAAGGDAQHVEFERRVPLERRFDAFLAPLSFAGAERANTPRPIVIVLRDLTREQQLERMRADFVANASHELRTPLSSLLGFIDTLQGPARNDNQAREKFLPLMRTQAERMRRLIGDLLSLSSIELNAHRRPTDIADLALIIRQVTELLAGLARENAVAIELDLPGDLRVVGEWDELLQVMQNLIENAVKYASQGRKVTVTGKRDETGYVEIAVKDFGPGIPSEHIPRLTERFYRVNVQESRLRGGTGLGLAIVKHILNRHRGKLSIASKVGEGSTFTVRLLAAKI